MQPRSAAAPAGIGRRPRCPRGGLAAGASEPRAWARALADGLAAAALLAALAFALPFAFAPASAFAASLAAGRGEGSEPGAATLGGAPPLPYKAAGHPWYPCRALPLDLTHEKWLATVVLNAVDRRAVAALASMAQPLAGTESALEQLLPQNCLRLWPRQCSRLRLSVVAAALAA